MKSMNISMNQEDYLGKSLSFIRKTMLDMNISKSNAIRAELLAEETIVMLKKYAIKDAKLDIRISKFLGDVSIEIKSQGDEFEPSFGADLEDENEDAIRSILLKAYGEKYKYSYNKKINKVRILVERGERRAVYFTIIAMFLGLFAGLLVENVVPNSVGEAFCNFVVRPIKDMFMNAIGIIIAPVVFFSLVSCIAQFKNLAELGRLAAKVMLVYFMTTVIATILGLAIANVFKVGDFGFALSGDSAVTNVAVDINTDVEISFKDTIMNIVPGNFLSPFVESDTLQIMFLAIIVGIAVGMIGEYSNVLKEIFEACNSLFLTITTIITKFIPVAVFCSVTLLIVDIGGTSVKTIIQAGMVEVGTMFLMMGCYGILVLVFGRLNPFKFFSNIKEGMLTSFTLASSSAAMPTNMQVCKNKLGISSKIYSFSIPLGATVNMDGSCIYLTSFTVFLARAYGVTIEPSSMFSLILVIILLSLASPGVPCSTLVCLGVVLMQVGIPVEAMGLILAINPIVDMFETMNNTTGDMAASLLVARSENLLDMEIYNK